MIVQDNIGSPLVLPISKRTRRREELEDVPGFKNENET
jgi:hypothetical protein